MKRDEDVLDIDSLTVSHIDRANKCVVSETGTSSITTFSSSPFTSQESTPEKLIQSPRFTFITLDTDTEQAENMKVVDQFPTDHITFNYADEGNDDKDDDVTLNSSLFILTGIINDDDRFDLLEDESSSKEAELKDELDRTRLKVRSSLQRNNLVGKEHHVSVQKIGRNRSKQTQNEKDKENEGRL
eukprot:CAMPEP_0197825166 /NCGR_PEP_ID=MMETSP1437-20131217/2298_1 /TAXON_ID=49252 ORGANISM="Eucampia antarctica, Strain CCMP1452" /NCGR_SAMPLE_ID=MMETSP1437 /ASSEMBLY_ACC=CAM_ASM_001096 /LENGTH=185 /DNA_ID=CAMNT_0043425059 /DNA_START=195 /DNA_END=748 /DNA_ORIENTATION=+